MKKWGRTSLFITAMLCLFVAPVIFGFTSHAATGELAAGSTFNTTLKSFIRSSANVNSEDNTIKKIIFATKPGKPLINLKSKNVGDEVTAYYDQSDKEVYVCCTSKIYLDKSCASMFKGFAALESIDFGTGIIDTSRMTDANSMFSGCKGLKQLNVAALNTMLVYDMQYMFYNCSELVSLDLGTFNTANTASMNRMFCNCSKLEALNVTTFSTGNVRDMSCMFYNCSSLVGLNLASFDIRNVPEEDSYGFLGGCKGLIYVDSPSIIDREFGYDDNPGDLGDCSIGRVAVDDDKDGVADSADTYGYFISSTSSHRYIFLDAIERAKAVYGSTFTPAQLPGYGASAAVSAAGNNSGIIVDGITYKIGADGKATVTSIGAVKKASIDKLKIGDKTYPVTSISDEACKNNKTITSVKIGSNVQSIGKKAFYGCKKLKKISIKANKKLKVEKGAFKKINKKARLSLKGVKGKTRKKLVKAIGVKVK